MSSTEPSELTLRVTEIFYSLQGEGARAGEPSIFIRLQGCSAKHACAASGVQCDTEFESGTAYTLAGIMQVLSQWPQECAWIIFTGGEPLDQLTPAHVDYFKRLGFRIALETSGVRPLAPEFQRLFDWVVCSPKVAEHILVKHFESGRVNELRYVRARGQSIPLPSLASEVRCISPHADGNEWNWENVNHCVAMVLDHPTWRLSLQTHKILQIR